MSLKPRFIVLLTVATLASGALAACGGKQAEAPAAETEPAAPPPAAEPQDQSTAVTETRAAPAEIVTVSVADSSFGPILVTGDGLSLYVYTEDKGGEIACLDEPAAYAPGDPSIFPCTEPWPALLTEGEPVAGDGVDASLLGTVERPDGGTQVTYNGHPLYRSSFDFGPGSTFGKGAWGQWFLVTVAGEPQTVTTEG